MRQYFWMYLLATTLAACEAPVLPGESYPAMGKTGAWCWFSDPRAIYLPGAHGPQIMTGWVSNTGDIVAAQLDLPGQKLHTQVLAPDFERDDHDNPAFVQVAGQEVLVQYTRHGSGDLYQHRYSGQGDTLVFAETQTINVIDSAELLRFPRQNVTYANPFCLQAENHRLYSFGRWVGYKPSIIWSDDNGQTWSKAKVLITTYPFDPGNRPYAKYYSDGQARIHIAFTDGHPRVEPNNSVYYAYYEAGHFFRANGDTICSLSELPFTPEQATLVYRADSSQGKAWIYDIAANAQQEPAIAYARYPDDSTHLYHYSHYEQGQWTDAFLCNSGRWFPQTPFGKIEREPNYSGGMSIHPGKTNTLYLSRQVEGIFEIEAWQQTDSTWQSRPLTQGSRYDNVRPYVPRNYQPGYPTVVLWMQNKTYLHYTDFDSQIRYRMLD